MTQEKSNSTIQLEGGTYEIIRNRLTNQAETLRQSLEQLNTARKEVFGAVEMQLIANDRINTSNYCIAQDITAIGAKCLFGYNVHIGLRSGIKLADVFSVYDFVDNGFQESDLSLLESDKFETDFQNLYRYYKDATFAKFIRLGAYLYMVFNISKNGTDFKAFKWLVKDEKLVYIDARSDHEVRFPKQHEFKWIRANRDMQRNGRHPHVSIMDRVFVETVGGDLTIKVEDNTEDGLGIYRESVEYPDQTLDDAEYLYADLGNLIALKIRPYQEAYRYFIFNEKMQEVQRVDTLQDSGVLLPDEHGLIFANGFYLQTGEYKIFDPNMRNKQFERRIISPNGEDYLFVFHNNETGRYVLLPYNMIQQQVATPIVCHGYTLFPNGELCYFKAEADPTKHHVVQIWQTPYLSGQQIPSAHTDNYLYKIGNKDIVKAMAECYEILTLSTKEDSYANLYDDLVRKCTDVLDSYYWIDKEAAFQVNKPLLEIRNTAVSAIDEFEKKLRIEQNTRSEISGISTRAEALFDEIRRQNFDRLDEYVATLAALRQLRGEIITLKELRYTDLGLVADLEEKAGENVETLSTACIEFLLQDDALLPYEQKIETQSEELNKVQTAKEAETVEEAINTIGNELELMIEIVSNLKIEDATQTTRIIDNISGMYAGLNQVKAAVKRKQKSLMGKEAVAEFNAQLKLVDQSIVNYLDVSDTPAKCDEYLTKLMVQLEELEGKFVEFDEFTLQLTEKREEIYTAFESRRNSLVEARNNRTAALAKAAERILTGIRNRIKNFKEVSEINGFFASDLMIDKVRDIVGQLNDLEDSNKANDVQTQLKTLKEESIRQLRDKKELYVDGKNIIQFGRHKFSVNVQPLELTIVHEDGKMYFHLTGTNFYKEIQDSNFLSTKDVWNQSLISENKAVYRSEYLAYQLFSQLDKGQLVHANGELLPMVQNFASSRYQEAYTKGIHDTDASAILKGLLTLYSKIDLLSFSPRVRAYGQLFWKRFSGEQQVQMNQQLKSAGIILQVFPDTHEFDYLIDQLEEQVRAFATEQELFDLTLSSKIAQYLFRELTRSDQFIISMEAAELYEEFLKYLKKQKSMSSYEQSVAALTDNTLAQYQLIRKWIQAFTEQLRADHYNEFLEEAAVLLLLNDFDKKQIVKTRTKLEIEALHGNHPLIKDGKYALDYNAFIQKMERYNAEIVPRYTAFVDLKKDLSHNFRNQLRLDEFKPRVLSSFVRNRLIDQLYLPIFGDNLAKQMGTAGEETRTDRMGMLLLISPPGYGKTTLMEYVANRLGLIFMKINGPAIGHQVTALDPADAPNRAAAQELNKLNLALEMGDNVMLYLDDIQHCNPELLQKFISLCDAQRKIEGVYEGESKTYDLRGKRFCVVMAGNPYTESGEKFQIPDMLANRADIYNLGDIIGDSADVFKLSYIENALTSNPTLARLAAKSMKDVYNCIQYAETGSREGLSFEANYSAEELNEYLKVLEKMLEVRDVVLAVNQEYIRSAAMSEDYRKEPAFKLQGSYRNMNKMAEKIVPIMNEEELQTLILSHYEGESQTLTSDAEANFLKLKELMKVQTKEEAIRWQDIIKTFNKNKVFKGMGDNNPMTQVLAQMTAFTDGLEGIKEVLQKGMK